MMLWYLALLMGTTLLSLSRSDETDEELDIAYPPTYTRLCRSVHTNDLPQKQLADFTWMGKPREFEKLKPSGTQEHHSDLVLDNATTPVGTWKLYITRPEPNFVGLLYWDEKYKYGSRKADEIRHANPNVTRISLSTVPITGNHWMRALITAYTNETTCSVWSERGEYYPDQGGIYCQHPTRIVQRPEHVYFVKNHVPFQAVLQKDNTYDALFQNVSFRIMTIRNPFDGRRSWMKFMHKPFSVQKYSWAWAAHYGYHHNIKSIPMITVRYEDMLIDLKTTMGEVVKHLPPQTFVYSYENLQRTVTKAPSKSPFEKSCGIGLLNLSHIEIKWTQDQFGHTLQGYGYKLVFEAD